MTSKSTPGLGTALHIQYNVLPQADGFTVRIISPQNSIHRVGGFKTEDDAQMWIGEAEVLIQKSRWFE